MGWSIVLLCVSGLMVFAMGFCCGLAYADSENDSRVARAEKEGKRK